MGSAVSWTKETDANGNTTSSSATSGRETYGDETDYNSGALAQTTTGKAIALGEQDKSDAYFDKIYVGFWMDRNTYVHGGLPHPMVDKIEINDDFTYNSCSYSLRINQNKNDVTLSYIYKIDNKKKYTFSFLSDSIPDPRALFFIEGSKYVCEKITATFHEDTGKSQLLKGVFYKII